MHTLKPITGTEFLISATAEWSDIIFETNLAGISHTWIWTISWKNFKTTGIEKTNGNSWNAKDLVTNFGGELTVVVKVQSITSGSDNSKPIELRSVIKIRGTNPSSAQIAEYLGSKVGSDGFGKIIAHETKNKNFNGEKEPIKSFDNGYGICQLTTPSPSFSQIWNWKMNIDAGLVLFSQKRNSAISYLSQGGRTYTTEQLKYETVCRWNGGAYHVWDETSKAWTRPSSATDILCDSNTGNIGWSMKNIENANKTEAQLRERDKALYAKPPTADANWRYSGVCYADKVLN